MMTAPPVEHLFDHAAAACRRLKPVVGADPLASGGPPLEEPRDEDASQTLALGLRLL
jgi:hypothetical protein